MNKSDFLKLLFLKGSDLFLGTSVYFNLKRIQSINNLSKIELEELRERKLKKLLEHATKKSAFYKQIKPKTSGSIDSKSWVQQFPVLAKSAIRENFRDIATTSLEKLIKCETSGSSGEQTTIYVGKNELSISRAYQLMWWEWAGYEFGQPILQTGLQFERNGLKRLKDQLLNVEYILAFSHNPDHLVPLFEKISREGKSYFLGGYASSLFSIATIIENAGIELNNVKSALSWGDKLFPHYKQKIQDIFNCPVFESYGTAEELMIASQFDSDFMYIMEAHVYIEILNDKNELVDDGQMGHVAITALDNYAFPLIRYKLGDLAIKLPRDEFPSESKLNFSMLKRVIGRNTDIIKTSWGEILIVHSFTGIIEFFQEIEKFQVIQEKLDHIEIKYVPGINFQRDVLEKIRGKINEELSSPLGIEFSMVEDIPPSPSGKPEIVINKLV